MYTYCDKGGAVAAVVFSYYVKGGYDFSGLLPQGLGKVLLAQHSRTPLPVPSAIEMKTTNMACSTMKDPLHTTLNSIAIDPYCLSLLLPGFSAKRAQCANYLLWFIGF